MDDPAADAIDAVVPTLLPARQGVLRPLHG